MKKTTLIRTALFIGCLFLSQLIYAQTVGTKAFEVTISGKGEPMLFIPGAASSGEVWKETVAHFSKNHTCYVVTLAGYAGVPPIGQPPYLDTYKTELIRYIKDKKLKNIILVGHSIGGFLALSIASEMKENLKKVIIVDGLPFYTILLDPAAKSGFREDQAKAMFDAYSKMDINTLRANQKSVASTMCADSTKWDLIAEWGAKSDPKTMAYTMYEMLGNDIRENIASIQVPVLVLAAFAPVPQYPQFTREWVLSSYQQQYAKCKTCEVRVSPSSKHFIMYDAPEWFYQEIDTFIKAG